MFKITYNIVRKTESSQTETPVIACVTSHWSDDTNTVKAEAHCINNNYLMSY